MKNNVQPSKHKKNRVKEHAQKPQRKGEKEERGKKTSAP